MDNKYIVGLLYKLKAHVVKVWLPLKYDKVNKNQNMLRITPSLYFVYVLSVRKVSQNIAYKHIVSLNNSQFSKRMESASTPPFDNKFT